jgi:hypothetical protein
MEKTIISRQFTIEWRDILKGLVMAVLTPVMVIVQQTLDKGDLVFNWKQLSMAAVAGAVAYIAKNFFEPTKTVKILK